MSTPVYGCKSCNSWRVFNKSFALVSKTISIAALNTTADLSNVRRRHGYRAFANEPNMRADPRTFIEYSFIKTDEAGNTIFRP